MSDRSFAEKSKLSAKQSSHVLASNSFPVRSLADSVRKLPIQAKLSIGQPNDRYELEADRVADQVLNTPPHSRISNPPPSIQRFSGQSSEQMVSAPASVDQVLASPGTSLQPELRQDMEGWFGRDFSQVRVHTNAAAAQSARDLRASAYTVGQNIVFSAGRFSPSTEPGRSLLAHELTHVVQQGSGMATSVQARPANKGSLAHHNTKPAKPAKVSQAAKGPLTDKQRIDLRRRASVNMMLAVDSFTSATRDVGNAIHEEANHNAAVLGAFIDIFMGFAGTGLAKSIAELADNIDAHASLLAYRLAYLFDDEARDEQLLEAATKIGRSSIDGKIGKLAGETNEDLFLQKLRQAFRESVKAISDHMSKMPDEELLALTANYGVATEGNYKKLVSRLLVQLQAVTPLKDIGVHGRMSNYLGKTWHQGMVFWVTTGYGKYLAEVDYYSDKDGTDYTFSRFVNKTFKEAIVAEAKQTQGGTISEMPSTKILGFPSVIPANVVRK